MFDFDTFANGPVFAVFSEPVTYTPQNLSATFSLQSGGIFDDAHKEVQFQNGVPLSTTNPILGVRIADFMPFYYPAQGDLLVIRNTSWTITDVQADSHGFAKLVVEQTVGAT